MVIQHNISALNSWRNIKLNNNGTAKNLEKLSSGSRINRSADDAAGLAISEKMRGQIRGTNMGTQNVNMGVNLVQTAEGGLNETHSILQRMRELAVQSANGTYQDEDRVELDKEFQALKSEIDRVANTTDYNGIPLLSVPDKVNEFVKVSERVDTLYVYESYVSNSALTSNKSVLQSATLTDDDTKSIQTYYLFDGSNYSTTQFNIEKYILNEDSDFQDFLNNTLFETDGTILPANAQRFADTVAAALEQAFSDKGYSLPVTGSIEADGKVAFNLGGPAGSGFNMGGCNAIPTGGFGHYFMHSVCRVGGVPIDTGITTTFETWDWVEREVDPLWIQSGANRGDGMYVKLCDARSPALGIDKTAVDPQESANEAISLIDNATNIVSSYRADFGASQNRLESAARNNGATAENLQAAESSIRDLDMAKEMMGFTKNNILIQASQSMLAQATQLPQGVLSLLR